MAAEEEDEDADEDEESRESGGVWKKLKGAEKGRESKGGRVRARVRWRMYKVSGS